MQWKAKKVRHKADFIGRLFGAALILGPADEADHWITECQSCGTRAVRSRSAVRGLQSNQRNYRGCSACKHTYQRPRTRGVSLPAGKTERPHCDIGVIWDAIGFRSTQLGLLQQAFYLGQI